MSALEVIAKSNPDSRRFTVHETPIGVAEIIDSCAGVDFTVVRSDEGLTIVTDEESWSCAAAEEIWEEIR